MVESWLGVGLGRMEGGKAGGEAVEGVVGGAEVEIGAGKGLGG